MMRPRHSVPELLPQSHTVSGRAGIGALKARLQSPRAVPLGCIVQGEGRTEALGPQHWGVSGHPGARDHLARLPKAPRRHGPCFRIPSAHIIIHRERHTESHTYAHRLGRKPPAPGTGCRKSSAAQAFFTSAFPKFALRKLLPPWSSPLSLTHSRPHPFPP